MQVNAQKIVVLATGGTIAGRAVLASDNLGYRAATAGVAELLQGLEAPAGTTLVGEQVAQVDSKDMEHGLWLQLAARCAHWLAQEDVAGVVVTHGTDTMEETAFFLDAVLPAGKPVMLTGAMRPASSAAPDGPQNLADALAVAATREARGVLVAFAGQVHGARAVTKVHSYRLDAFDSGESGAIAVVEEGVARALQPWPSHAPRKPWSALPPAAAWPRVEVVLSHAGASGLLVDALVAQGVAGLVAAGTGNGTLHHALEEALLRAQAQGVRVWRSSRCARGHVLPHPGDRLPHAAGLSPVKARIALLLDLLA
jgi:L-asparaginase